MSGYLDTDIKGGVHSRSMSFTGNRLLEGLRIAVAVVR
jgi:hypothetical protein